MEKKTQSEESQRVSTLLENLVARFPTSCVCLKAVFDDYQKHTKFYVLHVNAGFEAIIGLPKNALEGKATSDVFGSLDTQTAKYFAKVINNALDNTNQINTVKVRMLEHIYNASFLFVDDIHLLIIFEDIHSKYFRQHYHRSIPRNVVETSFAKAQRYVPNNKTPHAKQASETSIFDNIVDLHSINTVEILQDIEDSTEPYDAVFRDPLTGLYNRIFAMEALHMFVDSAVLPMSIALGDVNGLKTINESLGYHAGDDILIRVAQVFLDNCRADDVVTRWNDGQFMLLLPHASQVEVQNIIKRLEKKLNVICNNAYNIVTFGYATSDAQVRPAENLIREAEKWIYQKKLLINQSHRSSIIRLLLAILHEKSAETQEHSDRMSNHCRWLAKKLHLSNEMVNDLILLSMLHDIGKIGIPDSILNKPGRLTPKELHIVRKHPEIGYRIAQTVQELKPVSEYILAHHEHWDGTGYPKGLIGDEIPIASRIIAIVDAFDVMTTGRNYQPAITREEAVVELKRCAGTQFDPTIIAIYIPLVSSENQR